MGNIVLLDDLTINKIAAGEVIERPASVVKEMVENSIDAGATKITVEIKNGGISFIRVSDNGKGIAADDMEIAFERHATSKIRSADDILKVVSMGFRGEALASIAAVANVEMVSRKQDSEIGNRIVVEGGNILDEGEIGAPVGTTITVRNLFYNTPVRYKFLKKDYTESGYIEDAITRLALVNKNIAFKLINSGKTIIQTSGNGNNKDIIYNIYGKDVASSILDVDSEYEGIKIMGVVGKPEIARGNRSYQMFFVNKRYIKDRTLNAAVEQAFKGMIPINKYGFAILNIEISPELVDVNVHPAKLEVRFEDDSKIFKAVYHAVKDALAKGELVEDVIVGKEYKKPVVTTVGIPEISKKVDNENQNLLEEIYKFREGLKEIGVAEVSSQYNIQQELSKNEVNEEIKTPSEEQVNKATDELIKERETREILDRAIESTRIDNSSVEAEKVEESDEMADEVSKIGEISNVENSDSVSTKENPEDFKEMYNSFFGRKQEVSTFSEENVENNTENVENNADKLIRRDDKEEEVEPVTKSVQARLFPNNPISYEKDNNKGSDFKDLKNGNYKLIGIVFDTYIIVQTNNEMYMIDQHAAHERVRYDEVKKNYYSNVNKDCQMMLMPDVITLTHKEVETIKENLDMFEKAGFSVEAFGENTIKLNGVPSACFEMNTKKLFVELLDEIGQYSRTARQDKEERFIATIACKSAIKAKMKLSSSEVTNLLDSLLALPNPYTCAHGRPVFIKMTRYDLEKSFRRVM